MLATFTPYILFVASLVGGLVSFIFANLFFKKLDKLSDSFDKLADKLEQYVKKEDYREVIREIKDRLNTIDHELKEIRDKVS